MLTFDEFRTKVERYLGYQIAALRVDNAPELVSGAFETYCKKVGITYERPIPNAHQQNSVAERTIQTIEYMMRAMLVDGNMAQWFWPLAAQSAVHIKVRIPHTAIPKDKTPFKSILNRRSDLCHIRPFGSLVTSRKSESDSLNKVTMHGEEGRFVGYARDAKGYLIYFPNSRTIRPRRDVTFHGFPVSLPPLPPSQLLWDDIPFELERRFGGQFTQSPQDGIRSPQDGKLVP